MKGSLSWHLGSITATPELNRQLYCCVSEGQTLFAGVEYKNMPAYYKRSEKPLRRVEVVTENVRCRHFDRSWRTKESL